MSEDLQSQTRLDKQEGGEIGVQERGNGECSWGLEVYFGDYPMINMAECSRVPVLSCGGVSPSVSNMNADEQKQLVSGQLQFPNDGHKDKILGLELIARLQRRTKGLRRLTKIHGVDMTNETEDISPRSSLKKEVMKEVLGTSQPKVSGSEMVVENENNVDKEMKCPEQVKPVEEKAVNTLKRKNRKVEKELRSGARKTRARRYLNKGKRTVLSWMIDIGIIRPHERAHYMDHKSGRVLLSGDIIGDGILCDCCFQVVSISQFDAHSRRQLSDPLSESDPLQKICVKRGCSLLQCMAEAWNKQDKSVGRFYHEVRLRGEDIQNDVLCNLCGERGDLICCDSCPSTFHQSCLGIQTLPSGDWHCMYCSCKFCGLYAGKKKDIFQLSTCRLCEQRYHQSCLEASGANAAHSKQSSLCGNGCKELYERLEKLLRVKHDIEDGFSWSFICRPDVDSNASQIEPSKVECNAKLAVALSVMNEGFMPCIDEGSGINMIHSVLYNCGSNFPRLDCKRFITAILERDDEITSVASIRIHGNLLAEMPFVTTRKVYRKEGMFSRLLNAIESVLSCLNIELLVIPAVKQIQEIWIGSFGFEPLDLRSKTIIKGMNLLVFRGTEMLQKKIPKRNFPDENLNPTRVSNLRRSAIQC